MMIFHSYVSLPQDLPSGSHGLLDNPPFWTISKRFPRRLVNLHGEFGDFQASHVSRGYTVNLQLRTIKDVSFFDCYFHGVFVGKKCIKCSVHAKKMMNRSSHLACAKPAKPAKPQFQPQFQQFQTLWTHLCSKPSAYGGVNTINL
jgi:hypothetical protein